MKSKDVITSSDKSLMKEAEKAEAIAEKLEVAETPEEKAARVSGLEEQTVEREMTARGSADPAIADMIRRAFRDGVSAGS
jgi:hypothetical protein